MDIAKKQKMLLLDSALNFIILNSTMPALTRRMERVKHKKIMRVRSLKKRKIKN